MGSFLKDIKKIQSDYKKTKKTVDKLFGTKPAATKPAKEPAAKEEDWHEKEIKLTKFKEDLFLKCEDNDWEIIEEGDGYAVQGNDDDGNDYIVGYVPASKATFIKNHEDDMQEVSVDKSGVMSLSFYY